MLLGNVCGGGASMRNEEALLPLLWGALGQAELWIFKVWRMWELGNGKK